MSYSYENIDLPKTYKTVGNALDKAMKREGLQVNNYWSKEEYKVVFRRNSDKNQRIDKVTIFYYAETNINEGDLLCVDNKIYLTLNKETIESDIYRRSDLIQTNMIINTFSNNKELLIPCYAYDLQSPNPDANNVISVVNGHIELLTQKCEISEDVKIGSKFSAMGGVYKVVNKFFKEDNISHIFVTRTEESVIPINYTFKIDSLNEYEVGTTAKLGVIAKRDNDAVANPTVGWSSSDTSIISFTSDGTAMFNDIGECAVSALWKEHNITDTKFIKISTGAVPKRCEITYKGDPSLRVGGSSKKFTAAWFDNNGSVVTGITPVWNLDFSAYPQLSTKVKILSQSGNDITIDEIPDDNKLIGTTFNLCLIDTAGEYEMYKLEVSIISSF